MRLTDTTLDWALPCAVGLAVLAAAAVFLRNRKARKEDAGQGDSWERAEERRRKKEALYGTASYVLLFGCASVAAALSFHGLVGFGRREPRPVRRLGVPGALRARRRGHVLLGARRPRGEPR